MVQLNWHGTCDEWDEIKEAIKEGRRRIMEPSKEYNELIKKFEELDESNELTKDLVTSHKEVNLPWDDVAKRMQNDPVKHPSHYTEGKYECIDYIQARGYGFELGNAVKYITRAGKKSPEKKIEDLRKAIQYLDFYIKPNNEWIGITEYSSDKYLPGLLASALWHIDKAQTTCDPTSREIYIEMAKDCIEAYISRISNSDYDKEMVGNRTE